MEGSGDTSGPSSPRASRVGAVLGGRYRLVRLLGNGGMGSVYKAENMAIGRFVAVKVLHAHLADDGVVLARFQREARAAASVAHQHVVEVMDMGVDDGSPYIVMEYLQGKSLADVLRAQGPLPVARAAGIAGQILSALGRVHSQGIVHRDLKPENVLLTTRDGKPDFVKLLDFGIATFEDAAAARARAADLTPHDRTMATLHYASPEQLEGSRGRDGRVDLWAVGVLLFEMITGHLPFEADNYLEFCQAVLDQAPPPLAAFVKDPTPGLDEVIARALEKSPARRYANAELMLWALVPFGADPPPDDFDDPDSFVRDLQVLTAREGHERRPAEMVSTAERMNDDSVRGVFVSAVIDFVRERLGDAVLQGLFAEVGDPMLVMTIGDDVWLSARSFSTLLEAADRLAAGGERLLVVDAGRYFAQRMFDDPARVEQVQGMTPEAFFALAPELWSELFAGGAAEVTRSGAGFGCLEVSGQQTPRLSRSIAVVGLLDEALRLLGARSVEVRLARAAALGDGADVYEATWAAA